MNRTMCREYLDKEIEDEKLEKILLAGQRAPSAKNRQPWYFVVIKNQQLKEKLSFMAAKGRLAQFRNWNEEEIKSKIIESKEPMAGNDRCVSDSKVCILVCWNRSETEKVDEPDKNILQIKEIQGVSAAVQNMCLAAFALGLGAVWLCSPLYIESELKRILNLNIGLRPICFICVGYPKSKQAPTVREKIDEIVKVIK